MIPPLRIQLLGEFRLSVDDQPVDTINQQRLQSLLAYLCLHDDLSLTRLQLASVFWPDSTEKQELLS